MIIIISVLFVLFLFAPRKSATNGFLITKHNQTVCSFNYAQKKLTVKQDYTELVTLTETDNGYLITVYTSSDKLGKNVIFVDVKNNTVKVIESTCSISKDCVHSPAISKSGAIYCAPHGIKIIPNGSSGNIPAIVG